MSTRLDLTGEDILADLHELHRVVRLRGLLKIGVWGAEVDGVIIDDAGRHLRQRTGARIAELLRQIGYLVAFETFDEHAGGETDRSRGSSSGSRSTPAPATNG